MLRVLLCLIGISIATFNPFCAICRESDKPSFHQCCDQGHIICTDCSPGLEQHSDLDCDCPFRCGENRKLTAMPAMRNFVDNMENLAREKVDNDQDVLFEMEMARALENSASPEVFEKEELQLINMECTTAENQEEIDNLTTAHAELDAEEQLIRELEEAENANCSARNDNETQKKTLTKLLQQGRDLKNETNDITLSRKDEVNRLDDKIGLAKQEYFENYETLQKLEENVEIQCKNNKEYYDELTHLSKDVEERQSSLDARKEALKEKKSILDAKKKADEEKQSILDSEKEKVHTNNLGVLNVGLQQVMSERRIIKKKQELLQSNYGEIDKDNKEMYEKLRKAKQAHEASVSQLNETTKKINQSQGDLLSIEQELAVYKKAKADIEQGRNVDIEEELKKEGLPTDTQMANFIKRLMMKKPSEKKEEETAAASSDMKKNPSNEGSLLRRLCCEKRNKIQ